MCLDIYVKRLWLNLRIRRVVDARLCISRAQVVQISSKLTKLSPSVPLLASVLGLHA